MEVGAKVWKKEKGGGGKNRKRGIERRTGEGKKRGEKAAGMVGEGGTEQIMKVMEDPVVEVR